MTTNPTVRLHFYLSRFETMLSRYNSYIAVYARRTKSTNNKWAKLPIYNFDMVVPTSDPGGPFHAGDKDHGYLDLPYEEACRMVNFYNNYVRTQIKRIKRGLHNKEYTVERLISKVPNVPKEPQIEELIEEFDALDYADWC
jgi:hypothetical protein